MTKQEMTDKIVSVEWQMFHTVNGDTYASCQQNREMFEIMRRAQYDAWDEITVESFLDDVLEAEKSGRNLSREKYIRMMQSTAPAEYELFKSELPPISDEKKALVDALWAKYLAQTEKMHKKYPVLALGGRPLRASSERCGSTSIETYQKSETMTYSVKTLRALMRHLESLEADGKDLAYIIQENTVLYLGYPSMDAAEKAMALQLGNSCGCN